MISPFSPTALANNLGPKVLFIKVRVRVRVEVRVYVGCDVSFIYAHVGSYQLQNAMWKFSPTQNNESNASEKHTISVYFSIKIVKTACFSHRPYGMRKHMTLDKKSNERYLE